MAAASFTFQLYPLEKACKTIVELCGTCPVDFYDIGTDGCADKCKEGIETECWKEYFLGERWGD